MNCSSSFVGKKVLSTGRADENINAIGNELKAQELQLIDELAAPEI